MLEIEFAGLEPGQFDRLIVTGDATLAGRVELSFIDGFLPKTDDVLSFLEVGGTLDVSAAAFVFPTLAPGFQFQTRFANGVFSLIALNDAVAAGGGGSGGSVPEPPTPLLLAAGLAALGAFRRRGRQVIVPCQSPKWKCA